MPAIHLDVLVGAHQALDQVISDPRVPPDLKLRIATSLGRLAGALGPILETQGVQVDQPSGRLPRGCEASYTRSMMGERFSCARHCSNGAHACKARHDIWRANCRTCGGTGKVDDGFLAVSMKDCPVCSGGAR